MCQTITLIPELGPSIDVTVCEAVFHLSLYKFASVQAVVTRIYANVSVQETFAFQNAI